MSPTQRATWVLVAVTALFGGAMALRTAINPWWSNSAVALVALGLGAAVLRSRWRDLLAVRGPHLLLAVTAGLALVAATHVAFDLVSTLFPALGERVGGLYAEINQTSLGPVVTPILITAVVVAEEVTWRGVAFELARTRWRSDRIALLLSVAAYAVPQVIGGSVILVAAAAILGTFFGLARVLTGRLTEAIAVHAVWSLCVFHAVPLV